MGVQIAGGLVGQQNRRIRPRARARWRRAAARHRKALRAGGPCGGEIDQGNNSSARSSICLFGQPCKCKGIATFSKQERRGKQIEKLKNKPDFVAAYAGQVVVRELPNAASVDYDLAGGWASRPPIRLSSVDFRSPRDR